MTRSIKRLPLALACTLLASAAAAAPPDATPSTAAMPASSMLGFTTDRAAAQRSLEQRFDAALSASDQRAWLKLMSSQPNHVGSPHDKANAEWMLARFK